MEKRNKSMAPEVGETYLLGALGSSSERHGVTFLNLRAALVIKGIVVYISIYFEFDNALYDCAE
jgi:hypothetical protein